MPYYYVNRNEQSNGDHEVHTGGCTFLPRIENRISLGFFAACRAAVTEARKYYRQVNGCYFCSRDCHTG